MKKPALYIASVIFTLLLIFTTLAAMGACVLRFYALDTATTLSIVQAQSLPERVHSALETEFRQRESTTGIPADMYAEAISEEALEPMIRDTVTNGFAYLRGDTATLGISPDFSALETKLRQFFSDYAAKENIEQNETYDEAVRSTIDFAEDTILSACDVFRFGSLNDAGVVKQAKVYITWAGLIAIVLIAVSLLLVLILFLLHRHEAELGLYWSGTALAIASLLLLSPSAWLQQTRWFDRFAVKTDQTFAAVTGYLYANTERMIVTAVCGLLAASVMFVLFVLLHLHRRKKEIVRSAKH